MNDCRNTLICFQIKQSISWLISWLVNVEVQFGHVTNVYFEGDLDKDLDSWGHSSRLPPLLKPFIHTLRYHIHQKHSLIWLRPSPCASTPFLCPTVRLSTFLCTFLGFHIDLQQFLCKFVSLKIDRFAQIKCYCNLGQYYFFFFFL